LIIFSRYANPRRRLKSLLLQLVQAWRAKVFRPKYKSALTSTYVNAKFRLTKNHSIQVMTISKVFPRPFWPLKRPTRPKGYIGINIFCSQLVILTFLTFFVSESSSLLRSNLIPDGNNLEEDNVESRSLIRSKNHIHVYSQDEDGLFSREGHSHDDKVRCIESTANEPKNFYYGEHAITLNILTSDRLSHKLVSNILQVENSLYLLFLSSFCSHKIHSELCTAKKCNERNGLGLQ
jgi:hypothetical protein